MKHLFMLTISTCLFLIINIYIFPIKHTREEEFQSRYSKHVPESTLEDFFQAEEKFRNVINIEFLENFYELKNYLNIGGHKKSKIAFLVQNFADGLLNFTRLYGKHTWAALNPPVVVLGTAGTGTRVLGRILNHLNVKMSELVNRQLDSSVFIHFVKNDPRFCRENEMQDEYSLLDFLVNRNNIDYRANELPKDLKFKLLRQIELAHMVLSFEAFWESRDKHVIWGFKEPQAAFVLPLLDYYYRRNSEHSSRRLNVIHVIRDGRDIMLSKQQSKKYQDLYVSLLGSKFYQQDKLKSIAHTWQLVNLGIASYANRNRDKIGYVSVRLEDLCPEEARAHGLRNLLMSLSVYSIVAEDRLEATLSRLMLNSDIICQRRCHIGKYLQLGNETKIEEIETLIQPALVKFNYLKPTLKSMDHSFNYMKDLLNDFIKEVSSSKIVLLTVVTENHVDLFQNFLKHLVRSLSIASAQNLTLLILTSSTDTKNESKEIFNELESHIISMKSVSLQASLQTKKSIWKYRLISAKILLENGFDLILSDVDAIWRQDMLSVLNEQSDAAIIASQGRFPYDLRANTGLTICMGFVMLKSYHQTRIIMSAALDYFGLKNDDQIAFNRAIRDYGKSWKSASYVGNSESDYEMVIGSQKIVVLSFESVPRYCMEDFPATMDMYGDQYTKALVIHCYTGKSKENKIQWLKKLGLWLI